jgi:predicted nuclease of restriction endonuclease-like RecB superfamily
MSYWKDRRQIEMYRKSIGQKYVEIPQEIVDLEEQRNRLKAQLEMAKYRKESEATIASIAVQLADVESRMRTIISKLGIK